MDFGGAYCRRSSVVEQRFCKPQVTGSNPVAGSTVSMDDDPANPSDVLLFH